MKTVLRCSVLMSLERVICYCTILFMLGKSAGRRWFFGKPSVKGVYYFNKTNENIPPLTGWQVCLVYCFQISVTQQESLLSQHSDMNTKMKVN